MSMTPNFQNHTNFYIFFVAFRMFVVGERRNFKFCTQGDYIISCQMDDKSPPQWAWLRFLSDPFKFLVPLKYLWNG